MVNKLHGEKKAKKTKTKGYIVSNIHSTKLQEESLMLKQYAGKIYLGLQWTLYSCNAIQIANKPIHQHKLT